MSAPRYFGILLATGLLMFADSRAVYSQQLKLADSQDKKSPGLILKSGQSSSAGKSGPLEIEHLSDLASRLLRYAGYAGCHTGPCKILVANFILTTGYASPYGIQAADDLALEFARQDKTIQLIDRNLYKNLMKQLEDERVPINILNSEDVARWLGRKLGATMVLVGTARGILDTNAVELSARFVNALDKDKIGPSAEVNLAPSESLPDLSPIALPQLPPLPDRLEGEPVYRAGTNGVGMPSCFYMPNPPYPEEARTFHFSGTVLVEGLVKPDGKVEGIRFLRGAPYGIDESSLKTINQWRCKPAMSEGKPVGTIVPFEMTFRLY
jgi:TonB family protein